MKDKIIIASNGQAVNITEWQTQVAELIKANTDLRVIKPGEMLLSELGEGLISRFYERDITKYNGLILPDTGRIPQGGDFLEYDARFRPTIPHETVLYKKAGFVNLPRDVANITQNGVFGNPSENGLTSLGLKESFRNPIRDRSSFRDAHNPNQVREIVQVVEIDRDKLLKLRDIFKNPRGIRNAREYEHSVVIYGGIPCQAIKSYRLELL